MAIPSKARTARVKINFAVEPASPPAHNQSRDLCLLKIHRSCYRFSWSPSDAFLHLIVSSFRVMENSAPWSHLVCRGLAGICVYARCTSRVTAAEEPCRDQLEELQTVLLHAYTTLSSTAGRNAGIKKSRRPDERGYH